MKAIIIRTLPATDRLPVRLKVEMEGFRPKTYNREPFENLTQSRRAVKLARLYLEDNEVIFPYSMAAGVLPAGDDCVVMLPATIE